MGISTVGIKMMERDPNVWVMLFEHTPPLLRWLLGIMTLGLFTLASTLWRANQRKVVELEEAHTKFATHNDVVTCHDHLIDKINGVDHKVDLLHADIRSLVKEVVK